MRSKLAVSIARSDNLEPHQLPQVDVVVFLTGVADDDLQLVQKGHLRVLLVPEEAALSESVVSEARPRSILYVDAAAAGPWYEPS